jgi:hypothetical protein
MGIVEREEGKLMPFLKMKWCRLLVALLLTTATVVVEGKKKGNKKAAVVEDKVNTNGRFDGYLYCCHVRSSLAGR